MTESDSDKSLTEIPSVNAVSAQKLRINQEVNLKRSHASQMTPALRAAKPGNNDFFASKIILICKWCNKAVEHDRQSTVSRHMNSRSHQDNKKKNAKATHKTLHSSLQVKTPARLENIEIVSAWVRACTEANIPLNVSNKELAGVFLEPREKRRGKSEKRYITELFERLLFI